MTTRREFITHSGSLLAYFSLPVTGVLGTAGALAQESALSGNSALDTWIKIEADGFISIFSGKVELGQGIKTALAQIAAEELDVDLSRITMAGVDTTRSPDESYTFSSISIQQSGTAIRKAAAQARGILLDMAAENLNVPAQSLKIVDGSFHHGGNETKVDYWSLLEGKSFNVEVAATVESKSPENFSIVGQSTARLDIPGKVFGEPVFLQDLRLEGMVHARVVRPPADRARLLSLDSSTVAAMPGVLKVIHDGRFLAVIAIREHQASQAAEKLRSAAKWALPGDLPDVDALPEWLRSEPSKLYPIIDKGRVQKVGGLNEVQTRLQASYSKPYIAHGSISPSAAVALRTDEGLTIWSHAQGMYPLRSAISGAVGIEPSRIRCIYREAAGCYGHNGADDAACDAAAIAMHLPGRPVRLQWTRADEFKWEPYGSAMSIEVDAGFDKEGKIVDWDYDIWSCTHSIRPRSAELAGNMIYPQHRKDAMAQPPPASIPQPAGGADRNSIPLYDFPAMRVDKHLVQSMPLRVSALRGLGAFGNIFAIESFMDEAARAISADPFEYRLAHLKDERAIALLNKLREFSRWSERPEAGNGSGWGLSFARFKNMSAYFGLVMKLTVDQGTGNIRLENAVAVADAGLIVNPDGARSQLEGGIIQSSSWTLKEQIRFDRSEILSRDWASYPMITFAEVPDIHIELLNRPDMPSLGLGEAAQGPTAAAIANAVAHAAGKRLRDLPLTPDRIKAAG